ncbi:hypothetical protein FRB94_000197 [Tulasnella sp. JGI-2019a]|nr:hypothetical protein FRB94_000197 [Tulasnella sp. JGI-2019a]KAG9015345.1 hypothetical protein FRB93_013045 [Tulasnella sp. JGI-2019a]
MNRYTRGVDGSIPIRALLYDDEDLVISQDSVGLYDGKDKSMDHQFGTTHITTHRLFYVDDAKPRSHSITVNLANVRGTEHYAGFLKSSPKVTVFLGLATTSDSATPPGATPGSDAMSRASTPANDSGSQPRMYLEAWICPICSYSNPPSANEGRPKCYLCGVTRDMSATVTLARSVHAPIPRFIPTEESITSRSLPASSSYITSSGNRPLTSLPPSPTSPTDVTSATTREQSLACPACTFLNHPSMKICELCSTPLRVRTASYVSTSATRHQQVDNRASGSSSVAASRAPTPGLGQESMKISFRKGGDKPFYAAFRKAMQDKAWNKSVNSIGSGNAMGSGSAGTAVYSGIHGIMRAAESAAEAQNVDLSNSLRDLEALMSKAKQMVDMAGTLNEKLTAQEEALAQQKALYPDLPASASALPEEATFVRSSMARLGLSSAAVTQDMVKDEQAYHEELAKELAGVLTGVGSVTSKTVGKDASRVSVGLIHLHNGVIGMDEVWCGWNRARGVALIPPSSLTSVIPLLPRYTNPLIQLRKFKNGLSVLHTPKYLHANFSLRLEQLLITDGPKTSMEIARQEEMSVGLVEQMIEAVEEDGKLLRDEPGGYEPTRWYANHLEALFVYDGTI